MFLFEMLNLGEGFKKYFEVLPALTPELKDEVFRIRHNVYCEELKFEPTRPDGRETDEYDKNSLHCLVRAISNGEYVGCTRLVMPPPTEPLYPLPFEKSCSATLDRSIIDPQALPRQAIGEISRLAVIAKYRRRKGDHGNIEGISDDSFGDEKRPRFPYIPVGLYLGIIEIALKRGVETMFVLTEPRLAAHFAKLGVKVKQIGGPVEHRGQRVPSMMDPKAIVSGLNFVTRRLYRVIAAEIADGLARQEPPGRQPETRGIG
jgi:N-acyl amino acid synthase of PEP-CTERM/exosortase system